MNLQHPTQEPPQRGGVVSVESRPRRGPARYCSTSEGAGELKERGFKVRVGDVARNTYMGRPDVARHIIGCRLAQ